MIYALSRSCIFHSILCNIKHNQVIIICCVSTLATVYYCVWLAYFLSLRRGRGLYQIIVLIFWMFLIINVICVHINDKTVKNCKILVSANMKFVFSAYVTLFVLKDSVEHTICFCASILVTQLWSCHVIHTLVKVIVWSPYTALHNDFNLLLINFTLITSPIVIYPIV